MPGKSPLTHAKTAGVQVPSALGVSQQNPDAVPGKRQFILVRIARYE
jgi:hypothetical protein